MNNLFTKTTIGKFGDPHDALHQLFTISGNH